VDVGFSEPTPGSNTIEVQTEDADVITSADPGCTANTPANT